MTDKTISAEQVAILAERVDVANINHAELKGIITGMAASHSSMAQSMAILAQQMRQSDEHRERLFKLSDSHDKRLDDVEGAVRIHSWTWKLVGTAAMVCLGLVGWNFNELKMLNTQGSGHDKRITLLEFIVGGRTSQQYQSQRTEEPIK